MDSLLKVTPSNKCGVNGIWALSTWNNVYKNAQKSRCYYFYLKLNGNADPKGRWHEVPVILPRTLLWSESVEFLELVWLFFGSFFSINYRVSSINNWSKSEVICCKILYLCFHFSCNFLDLSLGIMTADLQLFLHILQSVFLFFLSLLQFCSAKEEKNSIMMVAWEMKFHTWHCG